jgi:hypothetical protein
MLTTSTGLVIEDDEGRSLIQRVTSESPEVRLMGFPSSRIELLHRRLVGMKHTALKKTFLQSSAMKNPHIHYESMGYVKMQGIESLEKGAF